MRFCDLGPVTVQVDGSPAPIGGRKPTEILALLLSQANRRVSVDTLTTTIWGEDAAPRAIATLESHIWRLRKVIEPRRGAREAPSVLVNDAGGYRLVAAVEDVDSLRFAQLADEVRQLIAAGDAARALRRCDEALALWRGQPYGPLADAEWAQADVARLAERHAQVREHRIDALLADGQPAQALADLEPLLAEMPYREPLWGQRMLALHRTGRSEEALQAFQRARDLLLDEVGIEPGAALRELQRRILDDDAGLGAAPVPIPRPRAASSGDVHLPGRMSTLIGRSTAVAGIRRLLDEAPLVTVVGAAGCGKTRLSIEVARGSAERFPDGIWFIDLSAVEDPALVADAANSAIGLAPQPVGTSLDTLRAYTRDRRMLLLLDNCEHVLDAAVELVEAILGNDSACHVLATSRETLGVDGERLWPIRPLAVAAEPGQPDAASPALQLLQARLHAADPTFELTPELTAVANRICAAVDGLPLALELAAARIRSAGLEEIAEQVTADIGGWRRSAAPPIIGRPCGPRSSAVTV